MKITFKKDISNNSFNIYPKNKIQDTYSILFNIISFGYEEIGKNYFLKRAEFHGNMLTYIVNGSGNLIFKNKHYNLKKDDLIFLNCMDEHILFPDEEGMVIYYMHIDSNIMTEFAKDIEKNFSSVFNFKDNDNVINFFKNYIKRNSSNIDNILLSRDLYNLLIEIRLKAYVISDKNTHFPLPLTESINFIKEEYKDCQLSLDKIANHVNYSKFYLERLFKKHLKTTVNGYLIKERISNAKYLLLSTNFTIEEIAKECGFSSSQILIKYFKNTYKETPYQYKKRRIMNGD